MFIRSLGCSFLVGKMKLDLDCTTVVGSNQPEKLVMICEDLEPV